MQDSKWTAGLMFLLAVALAVGATATAWAQPREKQAAAEAYDRGTAAYVAGDFVAAARWYETAHRHLPTAEALVQAARSYDKGGDAAKAATLALVLLDLYGDHEVASVVAEELLSTHRGQLLLVHVECGECSLELDGQLQPEMSFFVEPYHAHTLLAGFPSGQQTRTVEGNAGDEITVALAALTPEGDREAQVGESQGPVEASGKPLDPIVIYTGAAVGAVLLAVSIGFSADAIGGVDDYKAAAEAYRECVGTCGAEERRARTLLEDGQGKETRADLAWVAFGLVTTATVAAALLWTDWDAREGERAEAGLQVGVAPSKQGLSASVGWTGRF